MDEPTIAISLSQKVQTANKYEMAEVFISLSGITMTTSDDEMDAMLEQGKIAYNKIAAKLRREVDIIREQS